MTAVSVERTLKKQKCLSLQLVTSSLSSPLVLGNDMVAGTRPFASRAPVVIFLFASRNFASNGFTVMHFCISSAVSGKSVVKADFTVETANSHRKENGWHKPR